LLFSNACVPKNNIPEKEPELGISKKIVEGQEGKIWGNLKFGNGSAFSFLD